MNEQPTNPHSQCGDDDEGDSGLVTAANYGCDHCRSLRFADIASQLDKDDQAWLHGFYAYVCRLESFLEDDETFDPLDGAPSLIQDPNQMPDSANSDTPESIDDEAA